MQFSIWEKETFLAPQDVIIVGSGFAGLWSALYLKKQHNKAKITLVDKNLVPSGASTRNAGFASFGSLGELVRDATVMGTDKMLQLVEMRFKGLQKIQKFFGDEVDLEMCGGYELYEEGKTTAEELQENIEYLNTLLKPITDSKKTFRLIDDEINDFGFGNTQHLVKNNLEGYLHSGKLFQILLHKVQGMGVQVYNGIEIKKIEENGKRIELTTNQPFSFSCKQVLLCTNEFTKQFFPYLDIVPARGQVLITSAIEDLPWKGAFHSDEGFYYFRNLGKRILLGGARNKAFEDEATTDLSTTDFIQHELETYLASVVLPNYKRQYSIEHRWAGIMAMGAEKMPIVEQIEKNIFCAVRMGGIGVAMAPTVAQKISEMML